MVYVFPLVQAHLSFSTWLSDDLIVWIPEFRDAMHIRMSSRLVFDEPRSLALW